MATEQLTTAQTAERLNIDERTVRRYIADGKLPAARLPGGYFRIPEWAVEQILASPAVPA